MRSSGPQITLERSRSTLHVRSDSETRPITETRLSSFSTGEGTTTGNDWAMLNEEGGGNARKKVMVVVDNSSESKLAMLWALSHVVHRADTVALIHVLPPQKHSSRQPQAGNYVSTNDVKEQTRTKFDSKASELGMSLKMLCTSRRPEVEIEVVLVEGTDKGACIVNQAKKLEASVLILGQRKPSIFRRLLQKGNDTLVDYCIQNAECLTLAVRKKNNQTGGYLINSRWQKNFWLLA